GEYREATRKAEALAEKPGLSGNSLYFLALAHSCSIPAVQQDPELSASEKHRLIDQYGMRAVALLHRAGAAGFFGQPAILQELRTDAEFDPLRTRADFQQFLAELEAKAATAKPF